MHIVRSRDLPYVPAAHEDPRQPGALKRVLARQHDFIDGRLQMINWAKLPAGQSFRRHYHEDMQEAFVIIRGAASMEIDGESTQLGPGDLVLVPAMTMHSMATLGDVDLEYLVIGVSCQKGGKTVVVEPGTEI